MNDFPLTRFNPGKLPPVPDHFGMAESEWFWKLTSWLAVRTAISAEIEEIEDISKLLALSNDPELSEIDQDLALMNANLRLQDVGFSKVDMKHLEIPIHGIWK